MYYWDVKRLLLAIVILGVIFVGLLFLLKSMTDSSGANDIKTISKADNSYTFVGVIADKKIINDVHYRVVVKNKDERSEKTEIKLSVTKTEYESLKIGDEISVFVDNDKKAVISTVSEKIIEVKSVK